MQTLSNIVNTIVGGVNNVLWNYLLLFLLVGTGVFFTIRTRFVQIRRFGAAMKRVFGGIKLHGDKAGRKA